MGKIIEDINNGQCYLGIELGSTVIKSVLMSSDYKIIESGSYVWENKLVDNLWVYDYTEIITGLRLSYKDLSDKIFNKYGIYIEKIVSIGISGMMHGIIPLDKNNTPLAPFLTWRNTNTYEASTILSKEFHFNIPLRWTISQLYQAHLENREYLKEVSYLTTLAGYIHFLLTGYKVIGIDDASGMFPVDSSTYDYDEEKIKIFDSLLKGKYSWKIRDIMPKVLTAGCFAGSLTEKGLELLDIDKHLSLGIPFCPPEGDAATGMISTNSIKENTGNISLGTSSFLMVVLKKPLSKPYKDIDIVSTPDGLDVAMLHSNNGSTELNDWVRLFNEYSNLLGIKEDLSVTYKRLFEHSLNGEKDCGGIVSYNLLADEPLIDANKTIPIVLKDKKGILNLKNLIRSELYSTICPIVIGVDILKKEDVNLQSISAHGGLLKTKGVMSKYLSAAFEAKIVVSEEASFGGAYGMAILASYLKYRDKYSLSKYLDDVVFKNASRQEITPNKEDIDGFKIFLNNYKKYLYLEK